MKKKYIVVIGILILIIGVFFFGFNNNEVSGKTITIYKSPSCGCCVGHAAELGRNDFSVDVVPSQNLESFKESHNIPRSMWSCHTSIIGDYFVEGHMPIKAINKLLEEQPDIDGISLPGMPSGSPGMPGYKTNEWIIYSIKNGEVSEFMRY